MKIMQFEDAPQVRGLEHRGGTFHSRTTAEGTPGTPGNFKFSLSTLGTDYSGPRHRHNFDQYRYMITGDSDYGQDGPLNAGMLRSGAGVTTAADANDYLIHNTTTGAVYYDADGSGAAAAVQILQLVGSPTLTATDFTVI